MNWRYVPGSGAVLSPDELRVGERCAQLSGTSGARHSLSSGKRAAICRLFQSGMTCDPLTADRGVALWISSLADSRASRSVSPENGKASTTHGTCGLKLHASLENVSLAGYFSKTCRHSYLPGMEPLFSLYSGVWIRSGTMLRGVIYPLERSVLHMPANEYGLWVGTPTCGQDLQSDAFRRHGHTPNPRGIGGDVSASRHRIGRDGSSSNCSDVAKNIGATIGWPIESDVDRVADGIPGRMDRLRGLGNAWVPACAVMAWKILSAELEKHR